MDKVETSADTIASQLWNAYKKLSPIDPLGKIGSEKAYQIQKSLIRIARSEGERIVGYKIGLTSEQAQQHFKISHPDFGHLFHSMILSTGESASLKTLIQPKIEAEIAFVLKEDLKGPAITVVDVLSAIDYALPCLEIIDSRIRNWEITASDTIADNGSSALVVLGTKKTKPADIDFGYLGLSLSRNGQVELTGAGAAVMGSPLNAIVFLANEMGKQGLTLKAGDLILSGSLTAMLDIAPGDWYQAEIETLGSVQIRFERE